VFVGYIFMSVLGLGTDATMSDSTSRTLWCLLKGGSSPFKVTVNGDIDDLRNKIKEQKENEFMNIDADQLILLKVSTFLCFSR
jgi:hypothetical protein